MTDKKKFLKTCLSTASIFVIALGMAAEAEAVEIPTTNNYLTSGGTFAPGDHFKLTMVADNITVDSGIGMPGISGINLDTKVATGTLTVENSVILGAIGNGTGFKIVVKDGVTPNIDGNAAGGSGVVADDYSGLASVVLGTTNGGAGGTGANVTGNDKTFTATFDTKTGTTANWGSMYFSGGNHTFNGAIGSNSPLGVIGVVSNHTMTFGADVTIKDSIGAAIRLNSGSSKVRFTANTPGQVVTADIRNLSGAANNTEVVIDGGDVIITGNLGGTGGGGGTGEALSGVSIATNHKLTMDGNSIIYAPIVNTGTDGEGKFAIINGDVVLHGSIGGVGARLEAVEIGSNNTLGINGAQSVYADIRNTSGTDNFGAFQINGGDVSVYGDIGEAGAHIAEGRIATDHSLIINGTRSVMMPIMNITGMVDKGTFAIEDGDVVMHRQIGQNGPMQSLKAVEIRSDNKLTMSGTNTIYAPIKNAVGSNNKGAFEISGGDITIYGDIGANGAALKEVDIVTDNILTINTISAARAVYAPIKNTGTDGEGKVAFSGMFDATIYYDVGTALKALGELNIASPITLSANATAGDINIYAPITVAVDGAGSFSVTDGDVTVHEDVGTNPKKLNQVQVLSANTLTVDGNIYATAVSIEDADGQLTVTGGTSGSPRVVSAEIYNANNITANGSGKINVGDGLAASHVNFTGSLGSFGNAELAQLLTVLGNADSTKASKATISENSYFKAGAAGEAGIRIGENATLELATGKTIFLSGGATIEGAVAGSGTLILNSGILPGEIGSTTALETVKLNNYNNGAVTLLNHDVHSTNLDLIGGSVLYLSSKASSTNVSNILSSDMAGSATFTNHAGADLTVGNLGISLQVYSAAHKLTIGSNTGLTTFQAPGTTLIIADGGSVSDVLAAGNFGTFETLGSATFTGAIGDNMNYLEGLTLFGVNGTKTVTITAATDVYADAMSHTNINLNTAANNVTMHGDYIATNAVFKVNDKTLTIAPGGDTIITGTLEVNATYRNIVDPIALDFSGATTLDASGITAITLNINNNMLTPPQGTQMLVIKPPAGGFTTPVAMAPVNMGTSDPKWKWRDGSFGIIIYDPVSPASSKSTMVAVNNVKGFAPLGATDSDAAKGVIVLSANGVKTTSDGAVIPTSVDGKKVLALPHSLSASLITKSNAEQLGVLAAMGKAIEVEPNLELTDSTINTIAALGKNQGIISDDFAKLLTNRDNSGMLTGTATSIVKALASGGEGAVGDLERRVKTFVSNTSSAASSAASSCSSALKAISARIANTQVSTFAEGNYGVAAGDSTHNKFGLWGNLNGGRATQKIRANDPGFISNSSGFVVGIDTMTNDSTIIGFSAAYSKSNIKFKDHASGSKTDAGSWIGAVYANHQFRNNWFMNGIVLASSTDIDSKSLRRIGGNNYGIASAKYNMLSYGAEAKLGFTRKFANDVIVTPSFGGRVIHTNKLDYAEKGDTAQNNKVSQNAIDNYSALLGISIAKTFALNGMSITPEAHVNAQYGIDAKGPKGTFISPINPNTTTQFVGTQPSKVFTTYGASLTANSDRLEYGIIADVTVAEKYIGYNGSLKLKVKL